MSSSVSVEYKATPESSLLFLFFGFPTPILLYVGVWVLENVLVKIPGLARVYS